MIAKLIATLSALVDLVFGAARKVVALIVLVIAGCLLITWLSVTLTVLALK